MTSQNISLIADERMPNIVLRSNHLVGIDKRFKYMQVALVLSHRYRLRVGISLHAITYFANLASAKAKLAKRLFIAGNVNVDM